MNPGPNPKKRVWVLAAIVAGMGLVWAGLLVLGAVPMPSQVTPRAPFDPATWRWRTEEHWVVDQTVQDLAEMMSVAGGHPLPPDQVLTEPLADRPHAYRVRVKGLTAPDSWEVTVRKHLWDPSAFEELGRGLRVAFGVTQTHQAPGGQGEVLMALLDPTPRGLERTQQGISKALNATPAEGAIHDSAAAALAMFSLFHESGAYGDRRPALTRMSAHLAMSRALQAGEPSPAGRLARVALKILVGRNDEASHDLEGLQQAGDLPREWVNLLGLANTGDWRGVPDPRLVSVAEALTALNARARVGDVSKALDWFESAGVRTDPALVYHLAHTWSIGVEVGHRVTGPAIEADMDTLKGVFLARSLTPGSDLLGSLNEMPGRALNRERGVLEVISWGMWARRFQGNLLDDMEQRTVFLAEQLGSKREALQEFTRFERTYRGLELLPLLKRRCARIRNVGVPDATRALETLLRSHPEAMPEGGFVCLSRDPDGVTPPILAPSYRQWLGTPVPLGTAFNLRQRVWEMPEWYNLRPQGLEPYRRMSPWNLWLAKSCMHAHKPLGNPTPAYVEEVYAPVKAWAPGVYLSWLLDAHPKASPEYLRTLGALAVVDPEWGYELADLLYDARRNAEGLAAELKAFDLDTDRVRASNQMARAVQELHRTGRADAAERIALTCSNTGSSQGIRTLAILRELQGRFKEAETLYEDIEARYGDGEISNLYGFYARCSAKDPAFKAKWDAAVVSLFPEGIRDFDPVRAPVPPTRGVRLASTPDWVKEQGLKEGAILVAVDGKACANQDQYMVIRDIQWGNRLDLNVFQDGRYQRLQIKADNRRFRVGLLDHGSR